MISKFTRKRALTRDQSCSIAFFLTVSVSCTLLFFDHPHGRSYAIFWLWTVFRCVQFVMECHNEHTDENACNVSDWYMILSIVFRSHSYFMQLTFWKTKLLLICFGMCLCMTQSISIEMCKMRREWDREIDKRSELLLLLFDVNEYN